MSAGFEDRSMQRRRCHLSPGPGGWVPDEIAHGMHELEWFKPCAADVVDRVACLATIAYMGEVVGRHGMTLDAMEEAFAEARAWLRNEGLIDELTSPELELFALSPIEWTREHRDLARWCEEPVGVLLWAVSLLGEIPPYNRPFDLSSEQLVFTCLGDIRARAVLREEEEIGHAATVARNWLWRARKDHGQEPGEIDEWIRRGAEEALADGVIESVVEGDFAFGRIPFWRLDADTVRLVTGLAWERLRAFSWLCAEMDSPEQGMVPRWDEVCTDT